MSTNKGVSLRYKVLFLLISLPAVSLILYLFMANHLFVSDKQAYVYDSSLVLARSLANQVKTEINSYERVIDPIVEGVSLTSLHFSDEGRDSFYRQKAIEWAMIYRPSKGGVYTRSDQIRLGSRYVTELKLDPNVLLQMQKQTMSSDLALRYYKHEKQFFMIMEAHGNKAKPSEYYLTLVLYKAPDLYEAFATPNLYKSYLINKNKFMSMEPIYVRTHGDRIKIDSMNFFDPIVKRKLPEGATELTTESGHRALVAYADVKKANLIVASVADKEAALLAAKKLRLKSALFFLALIALTVVISIFSSINLTSTLSDLVLATKEIAKGNFGIKVKVNSGDEVGELASGFNLMAEEVSRLVTATADQARMEQELKTVKVVQETLFPDPEMKIGPLNIRSLFEPASECGGDWFHYSFVNEKAFLWIGDATGHGAPAALITSAAKSASAIIEAMPSTSPSQALEIMNHALHATSKGKILMTFFLGIVDLQSGEMQYSNASHEFPFVIPQKDDLKKKDLVPLCEAEGKRLGEEFGSQYSEGTYKLQAGDTVVFYTDGVIDLRNPSGDELGERKFIKALISSSNASLSVQGKLDAFRRVIADHRKKEVLIDDVTMFMVQYEGNENAESAA